MATIIYPSGEEKQIKPQKGTFTLKELQEFVEGFIEQIHLPGQRTMFVNEEGKLLNLPFNEKASQIYGHMNDFIVGNAVICSSDELE